MEITRYKQEDLIPVTMSVLFGMYSSYQSVAAKVCLKENCPELLGLVSTDEVDDTTIAMINSNLEGTVVTISRSMRALIDTHVAFAAHYKLPPSAIDNQYIERLAMDFYLHIVIDDFPRDGDEQLGREEFDKALNNYALSLIAIVGSLCILVEHGEVNLQTVWHSEAILHDYLDRDYSEHKHAKAFELLQQLGHKLTDGLRELLER
jgi:hypothetical protein